MAFYVYILASDRNGAIYVGSRDDLARRVYEHQHRARPGFKSQYAVDRLVWMESHETREADRIRERRIKDWRRSWKLRRIKGENPQWADLSERLNDLLPF